MEKNKNITKKNLVNESSFEKLSKIYYELFGSEYIPYEFSAKNKSKTKESDIGEGKLFTNFLKNKIK
jgi:hypothetical protein